jgi:hypothetical protein
MTTLAICTTHERPDLLLEQINNYDKCFNGNVFQVVHVNADYSDSFARDSSKLGINFPGMDRVHLFSKFKTQWAGVFHAMLFGVTEALRLRVEFDRVLFHTNSDLLVKRDVDLHVKNYDIGCAKPYVLEGTDFWFEKVSNSGSLSTYLSDLGHTVTLKSRMEGAFFRSDIFFELIYPLALRHDLVSVESIQDYPMEEIELVHAVEFYRERHSVNGTRNLIHTSSKPNQVCDEQDIDLVLGKADLFGIKRFSHNLDDPIRDRVRRLIGAD